MSEPTVRRSTIAVQSLVERLTSAPGRDDRLTHLEVLPPRSARTCDWPAWADDEVSLRAALDDVTVLVEPRWALLRDPDLLWLPTAPDPAESIDGLRVRAAAGPGVLVEGPYARLERLLDVLSPGGI